MTKHTTGPWTVSREPYKPSSSPMLAVETDDLIVAFVFTDAPDDARLIAAAPDLLEAAQAVMEFYQNGTPLHASSLIISDLREAIVKATGGEA